MQLVNYPLQKACLGTRLSTVFTISVVSVSFVRVRFTLVGRACVRSYPAVCQRPMCVSRRRLPAPTSVRVSGLRYFLRKNETNKGRVVAVRTIGFPAIPAPYERTDKTFNKQILYVSKAMENTLEYLAKGIHRTVVTE